MINFELTVELPNGDWVWERQHHDDFHLAALAGLALAHRKGGKLFNIMVIRPT
jgi:hypothetical protein